MSNNDLLDLIRRSFEYPEYRRYYAVRTALMRQEVRLHPFVSHRMVPTSVIDALVDAEGLL